MAKDTTSTAAADKAAPETKTGDGAKAGEGFMPLQAATLSSPGVRSAEDLDRDARESLDRRRAVAAGQGAYAVDEKAAENLAEQTNALSVPGNALRPRGVPVREPEAGFTRLGEDIHAIGQGATMMPLQHVAPQDEKYPDAVVNQPLGSEAGFVDPASGTRVYQPKTRAHLLGAGVAAEAPDDGKKVAKRTDAK